MNNQNISISFMHIRQKFNLEVDFSRQHEIILILVQRGRKKHQIVKQKKRNSVSY